MRKTAQPSLPPGWPTAGGKPSPGAEDRAFLDPVGFPNTREGERLSVVGQAFVIRREVHAECDLRIPAQPFAPVLQLQRRVTGYATVRLVANPEKSVMKSRILCSRRRTSCVPQLKRELARRRSALNGALGDRVRRRAMKALLLFAAFVVAITAAAVLIGSYIERQTSAQVGTVVMLAMFFGGIVVSWIGTVFVMDGSLKNFYAEKEQIEAEKKGRQYMAVNSRG